MGEAVRRGLQEIFRVGATMSIMMFSHHREKRNCFLRYVNGNNKLVFKIIVILLCNFCTVLLFVQVCRVTVCVLLTYPQNKVYKTEVVRTFVKSLVKVEIKYYTRKYPK